jgi:glycerol-3-phosphate dehydrogenase (NAD(P)+)
MSKHSRNRYVGEQIGMGKKLPEVLKSMKMVAEGVETCKSVHELAAKHQIEVPIATAVYNILFNERDPIKVTYELMSRGMKAELEF